MSDASYTDTPRSALDALSTGTLGGLLRLKPASRDGQTHTQTHAPAHTLPRALRGDGRLRHTVVPAVLAEWDRLRGDRVAPARSELDPARLATALEYLFVAEIIAPGVARLRLAGQNLYQLLGMEPRGMPLCCLTLPAARPELAEALRQVSRGVRVQLPLRAPRGLGRPAIDGLLVLLPLTDDAGRITRVLGVLETHGQTGRAPRRFDLAGHAQPMPLPPRAEAMAGTGAMSGAGEMAGAMAGAGTGAEVTQPPAGEAVAPAGTTTQGAPIPQGWRVIAGGLG